MFKLVVVFIFGTINFANGEPLDVTQQIGNGKSTTGERIFRDLKKRYHSLSDKEVETFLQGDLIARKQIAFLSVCKTYSFIREFTIEVLRENYLVFDYQISAGDFLSFIRNKSVLHKELQTLSESTLKKARQMTYRILEDAGLIDSVETKIIQPQLLDEHVARVISEDDPKWLMIFMMSDLDIKNRISDE